MKLIKNIFAITLLAIAFTGCEDFLEPNSKSEFVPKDATSLNELLLGVAYQRNDMDGFNAFLSLLDDDVEAMPYQIPNSGFDGNKYLASFTWQPDMFNMMEKAFASEYNLYEKYYKVILGVNAVIDYLPTVTDTKDMINNVKAQAYALRGFYYFNLVNIFGQPYNYNPDALAVPLKLSSGIEAEEDALKRKSVAEVYEQILSDLHTAEECYKKLPESEQWKPRYRTSLPMVQLMLSRTYLYMEKWENAAEYAQMVMENKNFKLVNLNDIDASYDEYMYYPSYASSETIWPYGSPEDMFIWTCKEVGTQNTNNNNKKMHSYFKASQSLLDTYDEVDLRRDRYIIKMSFDTINNVPSYTDMAYGKILVKSTKKPADESGIFGRCLRLSEAYLNYAEAQAHIGGEGIAKATSTLTALREMRYDPEESFEVYITDQEELIEFTKAERRRELCFEGHRWFDLRRWGMPEIKHVWNEKDASFEYTLKEKDLMYTVPIPDEALQENPKLLQNELPEKRTGIKIK